MTFDEYVTDEMIDDNISYNAAEHGIAISRYESREELKRLYEKGCMLFADCRSCSKFGKNCPL